MEDYKKYIPKPEDPIIKLSKNILTGICIIIALPFILGYLLFGHKINLK